MSVCAIDFYGLVTDLLSADFFAFQQLAYQHFVNRWRTLSKKIAQNVAQPILCLS
jgi:hypothetical protein